MIKVKLSRHRAHRNSRTTWRIVSLVTQVLEFPRNSQLDIVLYVIVNTSRFFISPFYRREEARSPVFRRLPSFFQ